jgi:pimeloyl-ACP methyl ester carboxylesterase
MPAVFVHGVPETDAIWGPLLAELGHGDAITLSPPGFGAPVPDGFGATSDDYLGWLVGEVEAMTGPIDLIGHDWGGGHVERLAAVRPDLIRSWCTDIAGTADPGYVWHDLAQVWQTPEQGDELVKNMFEAPVADQAAALASLGMTPEAALACATAAGPQMGRCILALYRSARQPLMTTWGRELEAAPRRPGLVICATEDHFTGSADMVHRSAERFGAREAVLEGLGHWWMMQDPARGAQVLGDWLASQDS